MEIPMIQKWMPLTVALCLTVANTAMAQDYVPPSVTPKTQATSDEGGMRLAIQNRAIAGMNTPLGGTAFGLSVSPLVTPGVRILDNRLFLGLGFGLDAVSDIDTAFHVSPTATYDLIQGENGALFLSTWLNLGTAGAFYFGANAAAGIRGDINDSISIGSEWGFTFSKVDTPVRDFQVGFFGSLLFEASIAP